MLLSDKKGYRGAPLPNIHKTKVDLSEIFFVHDLALALVAKGQSPGLVVSALELRTLKYWMIIKIIPRTSAYSPPPMIMKHGPTCIDRSSKH